MKKQIFLLSYLIIRPLRHPNIENVTVADILYALSDPVRLSIVKVLSAEKDGLSCTATANRANLKMPKSTCSLHYQILRESGLIHSERKGVEMTSKVRTKELEKQFPGLLRTILKNHSVEKNKG